MFLKLHDYPLRGLASVEGKCRKSCGGGEERVEKDRKRKKEFFDNLIYTFFVVGCKNNYICIEIKINIS